MLISGPTNVVITQRSGSGMKTAHHADVGEAVEHLLTNNGREVFENFKRHVLPKVEAAWAEDDELRADEDKADAASY